MQTSEEAYARLITEKLKLTKKENPFASLSPAVAPNPFAHLAEPEPEPDLLDQTRVPLVDDVEAEIVFLKDIRNRLANSIKERSRERVDKLIDTCITRVKYRLMDETYPVVDVTPGEDKGKTTHKQKWSDEDIQDICDIINVTIDKHLVREQISIQEAKALREASGSIAKMVEQYRKFVAGMVIQVEFEHAKYARLLAVIFKVISPADQLRVAEELDKYAIRAGHGQTMVI